MKRRHIWSYLFSLYLKTITGWNLTNSKLYHVIFFSFYCFQRKKFMFCVSNVLKENMFWNEVQWNKLEILLWYFLSFLKFCYLLFFIMFLFLTQVMGYLSCILPEWNAIFCQLKTILLWKSFTVSETVINLPY